MKTAKTSKRALLCSVLSIALCLSMLIGTTFAWFTDTASTSVNKIQAGKLDVALEMKGGDTWVSAEGKTLNFVKAQGHEDEEILWEPGATYELPELRVVNNGSLALKYKVVISGIKGDAKLNQAIDWSINPGETGANVVALENDAQGFQYALTAKEAANTLTISGKMRTDAGNEYQGLSIDGIGITVYATQYTYESDSNGTTYDKDADMTPDNLDKMVTANVTETAKKDSETVLTSNGVTATVAANGAADGAELTLTVQPKSAAPADLVIDTGKGVQAYDISVSGRNDNAEVKIELYVGKGLTGVTVYHKTESITSTYNATTGYVTFTTTSFSPFTVVYDEVATVNGVGYATIQAAMAAGGNILVPADVETNNAEDSLDARIIISKASTLTLNGKIKTPDNLGNNNKNFCALIVDADTTINATENGGIDTGKNGGYGINVLNGANLTINGGSYYGGGTAVQVQKGTLTINGGTFACEPYSNPVYGYKYLINCIDSAYKDGTAKIIIKGGTFINFDPSDSASENPRGNFLKDGYTVEVTQHGADTWYTVVPTTTTTID